MPAVCPASGCPGVAELHWRNSRRSSSVWVTRIGVAATGAGVICYLADIVEFYRSRSRKLLELNSVTAAIALGVLALSILIGLVLTPLGLLGQYAAAVGYLFLFGGLTGLGLSQLYKIVPFMTWLEVFGKKLGKGPVPRVQDLVKESRAKPWFILYFATTAIASLAIGVESRTLFQAAVAAQLLATIAIVVELWRARHPDPNLKPSLARPAGLPPLAAKKPAPPTAIPPAAAVPAPPSTQGK